MQNNPTLLQPVTTQPLKVKSQTSHRAKARPRTPAAPARPAAIAPVWAGAPESEVDDSAPADDEEEEDEGESVESESVEVEVAVASAGEAVSWA